MKNRFIFFRSTDYDKYVSVLRQTDYNSVTIGNQTLKVVHPGSLSTSILP